MTREEAKELLPVIQAYAEGKTIQFNHSVNGWTDLPSPDFFSSSKNYRIKPESEFRPFKNTDELIHVYETMMNKLLGVNQSFIDTCMCLPSIWIKHKLDGRKILLTEFGEDFVKVGVKSKPITLEVLFSNYTFCDDSPCGVEVKE